jgi:formylglycine-generating enzyme required for sulfatase activity
VNVSYMAALAFCDYYGLMLPSEAQWEKAARGTDGRIYPWGDQQPTFEICNFNFQLSHTTEVDRYPYGVSPFGLLDCAGNVWEWCAMQCDAPPVRGGGFRNHAHSVRCAVRGTSSVRMCNCDLGFRPAQSI